MNKGPRRIIVTAAVLAVAAAIVAVVAVRQMRGPAGGAPAGGTPGVSQAAPAGASPSPTDGSIGPARGASEAPSPAADARGAGDAQAPSSGATAASEPPAAGEAPQIDADQRASALPPEDDAANAQDGAGAAPPEAPRLGPVTGNDVSDWTAAAPNGAPAAAPPPLGGIDPRQHQLQLEFSLGGAGLSRIAFADFWETSAAKRQAKAHWDAVEAGSPSPPPLPADRLRYVLQGVMPLGDVDVPLLGVHSVEVDGRLISLFGKVWSSVGPGQFVSEVRNGAGAPMLRIHREFALGADGFDVTVRQRVENLSGRELTLRWIQYGPPTLRVERSHYVDIRRFHFGYLLPPSRDPTQSVVLTQGQMFTRDAVLKRLANGDFMLWPNADSRTAGLTLSWYGSTNRYFAFAAHSPVTDGVVDLSVAGRIEEVRAIAGTLPGGEQEVFTEIHSPQRAVAAGDTADFDLAFYAGPLDPEILGAVEPYKALGMSGLIVYLMSDCCSWCTFPWLARLLLGFLRFLHDWVVFDWGLAIIVLVLVVRTLLHPIMKSSQVKMQRVTRAMGELKPEMEKLQQRYKDDPKRLQQEQIRLYREKGVNPVGCVTGFVPTLLQMPIWIALYAMLYNAFELRQQPAFFGVFQLFWNWPFLADLSAADHFLGEFEEPRHFLFWNLTGINLLPILMGLVFWFQQKYMTPPSTVKLSPEQEQQQKIMKVMTVVMFPLMLYSAPSGLTLYIMTSSLIGIIESRQIRKHIQKQDAAPPAPKPKKKQDMLGRMYEEAMKRAAERAQAKRNPPRKFKER